ATADPERVGRGTGHEGEEREPCDLVHGAPICLGAPCGATLATEHEADQGTVTGERCIFGANRGDRSGVDRWQRCAQRPGELTTISADPCRRISRRAGGGARWRRGRGFG